GCSTPSSSACKARAPAAARPRARSAASTCSSQWWRRAARDAGSFIAGSLSPRLDPASTAATVKEGREALISVTALLWIWKGEGPSRWHFITVPQEQSAEIKAHAFGSPPGFCLGRVGAPTPPPHTP